MKAYWNDEELNIQKTLVYPAPYLERKTASYISFYAEKQGIFKISLDTIPKEVIIRPFSLNIDYFVNGNEIVIKLEKACSFSIETDGKWQDGIMVFASPKEDFNTEQYEHIIKFEAGKHYTDEIVIEHNNTLILIDKDAYISGKIYAENREHICIAGIGTISLEEYERYCGLSTIIDLKYCNHVKINGICVTDSSGWSVRIWGCENVLIDGIHVISQRGNGDGIDICGSRNVTVKNCFTRVWDDSLVVKAFDTGNVENILFEGCVLWNDFAKPIEVGVELRANEVKNVTFQDIDIIHSATGYPVMGIHHGDRAKVSDIRFEDIRIEDAPAAQLFDLRIVDSVWNQDDLKGNMKNILFKNISIYEKEPMPGILSNSRIQGFDEQADIDMVTIDNVRIGGKAVASPEELHLDIYNHVKNVTFLEPAAPKLLLIETKLSALGDFELLENGFYKNTYKVIITNTTEQRIETDFWMNIVPSNKCDYEQLKRHIVLNAKEVYEREYEIVVPPGKYVLEIQSDSPELKSDFCLIDNPLVLGEDIEKAPLYKFIDCHGNEAGAVQLAIKNHTLIIKSDLLEKTTLDIFTANPVDIAEGQVMFSIEETDFGKAPALICYQGNIVQAPQLRCPEEITYVFTNEPKVEKIYQAHTQKKLTGVSRIGLEKLGITKDFEEFWMEIAVNCDAKIRYPFCLFGSQNPSKLAHMFVRVRRENAQENIK